MSKVSLVPDRQESLNVEALAEGRAKKITIIGAGVAGLVAAYELERLGHQVEVLEGSRRIGGRIHTYRFRPGPAASLVELGAMHLLRKHRNVMHYIDELGLTEKVRDVKGWCSKNGTTSGNPMRVRDVATTLLEKLRPSLVDRGYREATIELVAWLVAAGNAIAPAEFRTSLGGKSIPELLAAVDRADPTPFLRDDGGAPVDPHAFFAAHPEIRSNCNGRLNHFIDSILDETSPDLVRLAGGMDQLIRRLAERIQGPVTCGQEVVGIDVRQDDVLIDIRYGDHLVTRQCDYVLCTIPFAVLRRLRLSGVNEAKIAVIHAVKYQSATKIAFHCREPFWENDGIRGGASICGGRVRRTYYPPVDGDPANGAALLASYAIGEDADVLSRMPATVRYATVLQELGKMHPELLRPDMVLQAVTFAWGQHWWSAGAGVVRSGHDTVACEYERVQSARPENHLFFAGEHCSSTTASIDGAIESAINAVREIHLHQPRSRLNALSVSRTSAGAQG